MTLRELAIVYGCSPKKIHEAAETVYGGKLPRGRRKWTREQEDAIRDIVTPHKY